MIQDLDKQILFSLFGIGINATIFYTWITMLVLMGLCLLFKRTITAGVHISRLQAVLEFLVDIWHGQIKEISNDVPHKYLSLITTFFVFIATSNFLTIIPWYQPPTASLSTTLAFAFIVFCAIPYYGFKNAGVKGYFKKFIDPTPVMLPLNILSDFSSTFSLAFRLYGNMLSGIVLVSVLMMLAPFIVPLPLQLLGLLTGTIQAYIFALLATVYVSAVAPEEVYVQPDTTKGE